MEGGSLAFKGGPGIPLYQVCHTWHVQNELPYHLITAYTLRISSHTTSKCMTMRLISQNKCNAKTKIIVQCSD